MRFFYHPMIEGIRERVVKELLQMGITLKKSLTIKPFKEVRVSAEDHLFHISMLYKNKEINPHAEICTSRLDSGKKVIDGVLRIGFYPVAANPFHWAHLLIGLSAVAEFKLDKVIYIISGFDQRKPDLVSEKIRHSMGKEVLKIFAPLFGYSSIAIGNNNDGETNLFQILGLNPKQKIDAFYIAGGDHYHRINPKTNLPDTIQKLEDNIAHRTCGFKDNLHRVSSVFIERGKTDQSVETSLPVCFLPAMPFDASSTMIREALQGQERDALALLPHTAYQYIKKLGLYSSSSVYPDQVLNLYRHSAIEAFCPT